MIRVLHLDTDKDWRGGQQQAFYLHEHLTNLEIYSLMFTQQGSEMGKKCAADSLPYIGYNIYGEWDLKAVLKIARVCKSNRIEILNCHNAHAVTLGLLAKLFCKNLKVIAVRRVDFHINSKWKYNTSLIDSIVCISHNIKEILLSDGIHRNKLVVIHDGIETERFKNYEKSSKIRSEFGIANDKIVIGTVAAFVGHKDYDNLLQAAKIVLMENKNVVFVAVGDGELFENIKIKIERNGLKNKFILPGYRKDVGSFLHMFDIFVMASKKEGLGTSILDAQSVGLPVVITRAGGMPEIVEDGITGKIVEPRNSTELAAAINELVEDGDKRKLMGLKGKESVRRFDINITVAKNVELYKNLLREKELVEQKLIQFTRDEQKELRKILIIQTAFIGDVILITPLIGAAKKTFPESQVDVMVIPQAANVLINNPNINSIILFDKRKNKLKAFFKTLSVIKKNGYDLALTPHSSVTTSLLMYFSKIPIRIGFARWAAQLLLTHKLPHLQRKLKIEKNLHLLSPFSDEKLPIQTELFPSIGMYDKADDLLFEIKKKSNKIIAIAPGSNWFTKRWPLTYYQELVNILSKLNHGIVFIGSAEERNICNDIKPEENFINLAGKLSLLESAALISKCDLMICNDSGAMHLANAVKTEVIVFFGPTVQTIGYSPIGENDFVFEVDLECRPCSSHGTNECKLGHHNCMNLIKSDSVLLKVKEKLGIV
ncbi:MAG: lipopolysaccharide heptosyltransferase II [Bacteroidota bacterium]